MHYFLSGLLFGLLTAFWIWWFKKNQVHQLEEQILRTEQEKDVALHFMHNLADSIAKDPTTEKLLSQIIHDVINGAGALSACIYLKVSDTDLKGIAIEGLFPPLQEFSKKQLENPDTRSKLIEQVLRSEEIEIGKGLIGEIAQSRKSLLIKDVEQDHRIIQHKEPSLHIRSMIVVPLDFENELLGILAVVNPEGERFFDETDLHLVESLGKQASIALQHLDNLLKRLDQKQMEMDLSLARDVQQMLLPAQNCETSSLRIHALYQPARKVSGDFYDIIHLPNQRTAFAIADVSGKGIPASLLMAICHTSLRHFAHTLSSPAEVLKALNTQLCQDIRQNMFITLTYGIFDEAKHTLTLARAGHELPLLIAESSEITADAPPYTTQPIQTEGMALCMVPSEIFDESIEERTLPFSPGDTLHLYTDGATETTNLKGEEFSTKQLIDILNHTDSQSPEKLNLTIVSKLQEFSEGVESTPDDITLLTIHHKTPISEYVSP